VGLGGLNDQLLPPPLRSSHLHRTCATRCFNKKRREPESTETNTDIGKFEGVKPYDFNVAEDGETQTHQEPCHNVTFKTYARPTKDRLSQGKGQQPEGSTDATGPKASDTRRLGRERAQLFLTS